ncbi:MAG: hypothetical protein ABEJ69_00505 [Candidatus Nanohaloarchaea archaeon]
MRLRERIVKGFVDSYMRTEQRLVILLLRTGRITSSEWSQVSEELNELAEAYQNGEITAEEFIDDRKDLEEEIRSDREEKKEGCTKEEALSLYTDYRNRHEDALEEAFMESNRSTIGFLLKIPLVKARYTLSGIRYS